MLKYLAIYEVNQTKERLKHSVYNRPWGDSTHNRDADTLSVFTLGPEAQRDSQSNHDWVMTTAREHDLDLVVFKPCQIQVAGLGDGSLCKDMARTLFPDPWLREYDQWLDTTHSTGTKLDHSEQGAVCEFYTYRPAMCLREHQGVYDVATGRRLTNRREIIERMWRLGFAAQRGRPLSIARTKWTGNREELAEISDLADRHWNRRNTSEAAKKLVSVWRSINRYAAWPGSW
jgi:hypothetical protein